jgi:triosephosphate isomerase
VRAVLDAGLKPILCIGETKEEYVAGKAQAVCARQLAGALHNVSADEMRTKVTIAYEPVWAIGTGLTATPAIAQSVHAYIRQWMTDVFGAQVVNNDNNKHAYAGTNGCFTLLRVLLVPQAPRP